ncbi:MAG: cobyric acid synthase CobQ, partial [Lachnospiraceae bacterium]|nr:cobyric acid synthase CobQ [Lachnospiraceae bacterium]
MLEELTGKPVLGVVPVMHVDIDDEDSVSGMPGTGTEDKPVDIAVIRLPRISNFTDFSPLENHPMLGVRYVRNVEKLGKPDMVIIPGTKSTVADLLWMRQNGLEAAILKLHEAGVPVLGVCGGYQILGMKIFDPEHVEGELDSVRGMELLPTETLFNAQKTRTRVNAEVVADTFKGAKLDAYEIHNGVTTVHGEPFAFVGGDHYDGCVNGNACGTYLHGLFDTGELTEKLAEMLCKKKGIDMAEHEKVDHLEYLEKQYDMLADGIRASMDIDRIYEIMDRYSGE